MKAWPLVGSAVPVPEMLTLFFDSVHQFSALTFDFVLVAFMRPVMSLCRLFSFNFQKRIRTPFLIFSMSQLIWGF